MGNEEEKEVDLTKLQALCRAEGATKYRAELLEEMRIYREYLDKKIDDLLARKDMVDCVMLNMIDKATSKLGY